MIGSPGAGLFQGVHPTADGALELGERVAAAIGGGHDLRDPLDTELARARIRATMLDDDARVQLGRYVVLERIGAGGMGIVYAAYDPQLDRKVALKVLHKSSLGGDRPRLLREAQALARLSHPNIVTVYDVGSFDGPTQLDRTRLSTTATPTPNDRDDAPRANPGAWLFIAMELVEGETLTSWLRNATRPWAEIVRVMTSAGRGLLAAHEHGLVHRDFKPDNVMISPPDLHGDERVRVMDFGLATIAGTHELVPDGIAIDARLAELRSTWTQQGGLVGTPAYMAPEQFIGVGVSAAADQFAFCVACWEALTGKRPFDGVSVPELCAAALAGALPAPSDAATMPRWLRRVLVRGLATDPAQRWPSMAELLRALERGSTHVRRKRLLVAAGAIALAAAAAFGANAIVEQRRIAACEREGAAIAEVWNDDVRTRLHAVLLDSGLAYANTTAERLTPWLDARAESWSRERSEACLDATVRNVLDATSAERSQWCFAQRRLELAALVDELQRADSPFVQSAITAVATWIPIAPCRDPDTLATMSLPEPAQREQVLLAMQDVARALALRTAGDYQGALELARSAVAQGEAIGYEPLTAGAHVLEGSALHRLGEHAAAEQVVSAAYFEAARIGAWDVATNAAILLESIVGISLARPEDGLAWGRHAEMASSHAPSRDGLREAIAKSQAAVIHAQSGRYDEAIRGMEEVLALREAVLGPVHPDVAITLHNLATMRMMLDDRPAAKAAYERAIAIRVDTLGPDHPDLADSVDGLGVVVLELGDPNAAREYLDRALAIRVAAFGPDHRKVAISLSSLGNAQEQSGDLRGAAESYERALAIFTRTNDPDAATAYMNLGSARLAMGEVAAARALFERSVTAFDARTGMQPNEADARFALAQALGFGMPADRERARELAEQALADHRAAGRTDEIAEVERWLGRHP
ncbi:MAG TPA: serine/threonine-protein kinase [Nannocystaceae bacterium]|nr:serine/threonine-protein kinase [Nannocystaceae bacterium]